jgi:hypothetical protein
MATNHIYGVILVIVGALMATFHRPLGLLQVKSQPRWLRLRGGAVRASRSVILLIGLATLISGVLALVDVLR